MGTRTEYKMLLAKRPTNSCEFDDHVTLLGHSRSVLDAFHLLFGLADSPTRLATQWMSFFRLKSVEEFVINGSAACALHDVGKANSGFQEAVYGHRDAQVIRHEHLSGLLLWLPEVKKWLSYHSIDNLLVISAIVGHHLRAESKSFAGSLNPDRHWFLFYSKGLVDVSSILAESLAVPPFVAPEISEKWYFGNRNGCQDALALADDLNKALQKLKRDLADDDGRHRLLMAVRAALVAADSAGSGLVRETKDLSLWLREAFGTSGLVDGAAIERNVIAPRVAEISKKKGTFKYTDFQVAAEKLPERALLLAACGSGKTLAAWRWIKGRAAIRPASRIIFLYPTRDTATEGFRDYVSWAPEADAALVHGTSTYELSDLFESPDDPRSGRDYTTDDRLFALAYWQRRIFSATVDQFLGFLQHSYRSSCLLPLLVDSIVVIDEVHSFDKPLFSALKRFLRSFDLPVLCMTASLPPLREKDLLNCGLHRFPEENSQFSDLKAMSDMPRYHVSSIEDERAAVRVATESRDRGKRVLWVVNTVARCQQIAKLMKALCYHSRFTLQDRHERHNEVIKAFGNDGEAVLAVTTQVCQMSLDLDADVLISEAAPITALIQRMERCNRHATPGGVNSVGQVHVYPAQNQHPYKPEDMQGVDKFLEAINGQDVSQSRLQELLEQHGPCEVEVERYAAFLEGGPWAVSREVPLRDSPEFTIPAVLDRDVEEYLSLRSARKPVDGLLVPSPRRLAIADLRLGRWPRVAPSSHYDPEFGLFDCSLENKS